MRKIIRLNENDLENIVKNVARRAIKENIDNEYNLKDFGKDALGFGLGAGAFGGAVAGNAYLHGDDPDIDPEQAAINQTVKDDLGQDVLKPQHDLPNDTISWEKANRFENRISRAITESINSILNEISTDTIDSASDKADKKVGNAFRKYGPNNPITKRAREQKKKFSDEWNKEYTKGNDARKARLEKNREDRKNGKRTYQNGAGWRTKEDNKA